jgi:hypothetical protein
MEDEIQRRHSNSYACNNRRIAESGVPCGSMQRLYLENRNTAESVASRVEFELRGRQSATALGWYSRPWRRSGRRNAHCCKLLRSNAELDVRHQPARSCEPLAREDVSPGAKERPLLENVIHQRSEDRDWEH